MRTASLLICIVTLLPLAAGRCATPDRTVPLPTGETFLSDVGIYRVAYQSYGDKVVEMPRSWVGHFTTESGISYVPYERIADRPAILMHSPWRVPPGRTWVDYQLRLPRTRPIRLLFGIAMGPGMVTPDRSDGVTFSCFLTAAGRPRRLMRQHYARSEWRDYSFDLTPYAGQTVTLRLQVEPGPKRDASWDLSYFGAPRIVAGQARDNRAALLQQLTSTRAYRATAQADLRALSNTAKHGVTPGNLLTYRNTIVKAGNTYRFTYQGADCRVVYTYRPATGTLDDFTAQVDGGRTFLPAQGGGATVALPDGAEPEKVPARGGKAVRVTLAPGGKSLQVLWEYPLRGGPLRIAWSYAIRGKALTIAARCQEPRVSEFSLGEVGEVPLRRIFGVPYLLGHVSYLPVQNAFVCRYLDWTVSHASQCPQGTATYEPKTDGRRNALVESGYVAVSPHVGEVLPNIPHPPSPYRALLGPKIMLDIWAHHQGTYQGDAENLRNLKDHGVDHLAIISHDWQRYGYDVKLPDHLPANPLYGGDAGMKEFGRAANECGYIWSLHENYIDLYPDAPSYDPSARVLLSDGQPSHAWFNPATGVQSFGLKCNRALEYARQNAPEIHRRFGTNAAYLDVHTCVPPWHQLDREAGQPMAGMALAKVKHDTELFQYMRATHQGPLFGEGANHFFWAGRCDGVEAQVAGGEHHTPFLDFDLLKIHPQMVNHGMGYYERWFASGYELRWGYDAGTMAQIDKYRAQELAYGHAGFIGSAQTANLQWVVREHHLMHPVQRLYGTARPTEILYKVDGRLVSASVALVMGDTSRQRIRYDSGLTLWVNWNAQPWKVQGRVLPQWGFLARGPNTEVCTVRHQGKFADYAECPQYVFADARTSIHMPYLQGEKEIEPKLRAFEYLGGNRVRLTYEWHVNDTLEEDYHCFVHFLHEGTGHAEQIAFQQDHELPKPTSQWRKGETIIDGPYEVTFPDDAQDYYDITIGLFRGGRLSLKGLSDGRNRILIGRLRVEREGGEITRVTLGDVQDMAKRAAAARANFRAHLNPPGTWVDFGTVATDGSVKVNREPDRLVVFPYPRDRSFRVTLDLKALAPKAVPGRVRVRALAARTLKELGETPHAFQGGRLTFKVGRPGAGRYLVTW